MIYALREALLHILIVKGGHLSFCCLPVPFCHQSGHYLLTCGINKAVSPIELLLSGYFHFFRLFTANPGDAECTCIYQS